MNSSGRKNEFHYEGGIVSFVEYLNRNKTPIHPDPVFLTGGKNGIQMEIAFQYNETYNEQIFTFANNINTREGGSHLSGFKAGLTRAINQYMAVSDLPKNLKNSHLPGGRRPGGAHRGDQRQAAAPPVRGPDQDQAGQQRSQGPGGKSVV